METQTNNRARLYPNRLSITPLREGLSPQTLAFRQWAKENPERFLEANPELRISRIKSLENLSLKNHAFILSPASKRKMSDSINSLYALSPSRTIKTYKGKFIYNFRCSFVTLTLPSPQCHPDAMFKSECLHHLFVELRRFYNVENYLWKAELQGNGNIHFHIITDQYLDYFAVRNRWNRILNKYGYVDRYAAKWVGIGLRDYITYCEISASRFPNAKPPDRVKMVNAWREGVRTKWTRPNSVDVKPVRSARELSAYLSKYLGKSLHKNAPSNAPEGFAYNPFDFAGLASLARSISQQKRELAFGRSWYRSASLAKLKYAKSFTVDVFKDVIEYFHRQSATVRRFTGDYFEVYYFHASQLSKGFQKWLSQYLVSNSLKYGYIRPSVQGLAMWG